MIEDRETDRLVDAARAACSLAFLTKDGGVHYGAAVKTRSGAIFQSGQYSSFNHSTNLHAECASILIATMAGHPDITHLALASSNQQDIARPCGICRQVMLEHCQRTGYDFEVVMIAPDGRHETQRVSGLIPLAWKSHNAASIAGSDFLPRTRTQENGSTAATAKSSPDTGAHIELANGSFIGMVWDPAWAPSKALVKLKYIRSGDSWIKLPHAFSQGHAYHALCHESGLLRDTGFGALAVLADCDRIARVLPMPSAADTLPPLLVDLIRRAEIPDTSLFISGSCSIGLSQANSDLDLIARVTVQQCRNWRKIAATAMDQGLISIPEKSGTWKLLDAMFPGGKSSILKEGRFLETFEIQGLSVVLVFTPPQNGPPAFPDNCKPMGFMAIAGTVIDCTNACYKRSVSIIECLDGSRWTITSYLKPANLLCPGDRIAACGQGLQADGHLHLALWRAHCDRIVWL
jgi:cytidine deaminase